MSARPFSFCSSECALIMSSSPSKPAPAASADTLNNEQDLQGLLEKKEEEIKALKDEIETYKQTIAWQQKEIEKLNVKPSPANPQVEEIAKESLSSMNSSGTSSKMEERWKNRFQQLVAYKLEVRSSRAV